MKTIGGTNRMRALESFVKYFGFTMALIYIAAGIFLLLRANTFFNLPDPYAVAMGLILITYGIFRSYRVYKKYFQAHENDN